MPDAMPCSLYVISGPPGECNAALAARPARPFIFHGIFDDAHLSPRDGRALCWGGEGEGGENEKRGCMLVYMAMADRGEKAWIFHVSHYAGEKAIHRVYT